MERWLKVLVNGMMTGVLLVGMKVGNQTYDTSASSFSLGSLDLESQKQSEET